MIIHKALHSKNDVDRQYVLRKMGVREVDIIEDNIDASIQRFEDYIGERKRRLITATRNNTDYTRSKRKGVARKQKWGGKNSFGVLND